MAPAPSGSPAIEAEGLVVRYGDTVAVDGLTLRAHYGEVVALLGPNGAGKTSAVEALEGYRRPASGRLRVAGYDPVTQHREMVPHIGVVLQRGGIYPMMSAERVLRLFASYYETPRSYPDLLHTLDLVQVSKRPYKRLSGGEQQRLALALALVGNPTVAFLDEPTAGVDPVGRLAVRDVVKSLKESGVCVLLTSHELEEVERLADRVIVLNHGRIVAEGSFDQLAGGMEEIRFATRPGIDVLALQGVLQARVDEISSGQYVAAMPSSPRAVSLLASWLAENGLPLDDLRAGRERLEDVFIRLLAQEPAE